MRGLIVFGVVLLVLGAAVLGYGHFSYETEETVLDIGPIEATAEETKTVRLPPILGWALIIGGAGALLVGATRSKA